MKLTVIASLFVLLSSEFSMGLASTVNHSLEEVSRENSGSVGQSCTYFINNNTPEPPDSNPGGSR